MLETVFSTTRTINNKLWCPLFFSFGGEKFGVNTAPDCNV